MLSATEYDKAKLLHRVSCLVWFIEKHAKLDAEQAQDKEFLKLLEDLQKDLDKYLPKLKKSLC